MDAFTNYTMTRSDYICALRDAADILVNESNQLAHLLDNKAFDQMNHRVAIAVETEMTRLRQIAHRLKAQIPPTDLS